MNKSSKKVFIAGSRGLAGSAFVRILTAQGYTNLLTPTRGELDLADKAKVQEYVSKHRPDWIIICAAKVGGIMANKSLPVEFFLENIQIQNNLIQSAYEAKIEKLLFLGSNCIYPKAAPIPFLEESLFTGEIEKTNEAYALAKIAGIKLCQFYNREYKTNFLSVIPTGLYGPNDNYHPEHAHVLPMLLRRFHEAKLTRQKEVIIWGSGTPLREFMYSDDMARASLMLMENYSALQLEEPVNIGPGHEASIIDFASMIKEVVGYEGEIILDKNKPDGTVRKKLNAEKITRLGFSPTTDFIDGLTKMYDDFLKNPNLRK